MDRAELVARYQRLGSVAAVAIEVLRERKTTLVADPLAVTIQGIATVNNAENVKAIERQIASIEDRGTEGGSMSSPVPLMRARRR